MHTDHESTQAPQDDDARELTDDELDDVAGGSGVSEGQQHLSQGS
jgi:hypothetical protein